MGHIESYQFVDPRVGDFGVCYSKPTEAEARAAAEQVGYSGPIKLVIIAYPPKPARSAAPEPKNEWFNPRLKSEWSDMPDWDYDEDGIPF
ncbi:hypothetical protein LZ023_40615 (plasmid) [Pseudomonas silvicola]|nr:hypothetical protein LZ023_40890 [Pseudomonas silvicola]WAH62238.1 hypothetical protein LZ023_40615 [Pseudomonas silvicola]